MNVDCSQSFCSPLSSATWSAPKPLCYDDGSVVCVPASLAAFERNPKTGRAYWFANILSHPVTGQIPRYPLTIAEMDTKRLCIIRDSVTVIQDLPEGAIKANEDIGELGRRYSNFGHYVDRVTGKRSDREQFQRLRN